ncbi:MAG: hypothetical protein QGH15_21370 [Kiritimatiellia bacterium]|jgi:hypothetical protein|nr:hypothetical protein [Kiritimatiellia bacterium]
MSEYFSVVLYLYGKVPGMRIMGGGLSRADGEALRVKLSSNQPLEDFRLVPDKVLYVGGKASQSFEDVLWHWPPDDSYSDPPETVKT